MQHHSRGKRSPGAAPAAKRPSRRVPTIILADDSIVQRMMTRALLEAEGYRVLEAGNGREVLELMRIVQADLVLMDVAMPSMDGVTAARRIRSESHRAAEVPIVFMTGLGASSDRDSALTAGANDYLVKPIGERELLRVVQRHARAAPRAGNETS